MISRCRPRDCASDDVDREVDAEREPWKAPRLCWRERYEKSRKALARQHQRDPQMVVISVMWSLGKELSRDVGEEVRREAQGKGSRLVEHERKKPCDCQSRKT